MSSTYDVNAILMGGGGQSARFDHPGAVVRGTIDDLTASQQTDFTTGEPKTWPNGDPMMQVVATLITDDRDPSIADDDGRRRLYIKGKSMTEAVRSAVRAAGAKGLEEGGTLEVVYTGDGKQEKRGMSAPKLYEATYSKPGPVAANAALGLVPQAAPAPAAPADAGPVLTPEQQAALAALTPEQRRAMGMSAA